MLRSLLQICAQNDPYVDTRTLDVHTGLEQSVVQLGTEKQTHYCRVTPSETFSATRLPRDCLIFVPFRMSFSPHTHTRTRTHTRTYSHTHNTSVVSMRCARAIVG